MTSELNPPSPILDSVPQGAYLEGQQVQLIIKSQTDLGYKAVVDGKYWGVLYHNEVFGVLYENQPVQGFVKKIREDFKLDLTLYKTGHQAGLDVGPRILELLEDSDGGFLQMTDKTPPEVIYDTFGVSKKKFKIALGNLYKNRKIQIESDGIRLVSSASSPRPSTKLKS
jgi:predicted RNA-binding protein (virulence factor B family)